MGGCKGVRQAVVGVVEEGGRKRLVGYVVGGGEGGERMKVEEMRKEMERKLPGYMIPGEIVELEKMPVTANGKVDRKELERMGREGGEGRRRREESVEEGERGKPRDEVEEVLCGIWREVLRRERV